MSGRVAGKIALVTGAAQGIGAAIAWALAREGAKALVTDINAEGVAAVANAIDAELGPGVAYAMRHDVTSEADWIAVIAQAQDVLGGLSVLVNNATAEFLQCEALRSGGMAERANAQRYDLARLEAYLKGAIPGFGGPAQIKRFSGGQSNPTFLLSTADRSYVLRKKPDGPLLPSAHAVDREYRVMRTVRAAGVPAPVMLCLTLK